MSLTQTTWLNFGGDILSKPHYASAPGVAAGMPGQTFWVGVTFLFIQVEEGIQGGLLQNFDVASSRGWRIFYNHGMGQTTVSAEIGLSDGSTVVLGGQARPSFPGNAVQLLLAVNANSAIFSANGVVLDAANFGPLSFAPAPNSPLEFPAQTGFPVNGFSGLAVLGAGYDEQASPIGQVGTSAIGVGHMRLRDYSKTLSLFNVFGDFSTGGWEHAWDTKSLLEGGLFAGAASERVLASSSWPQVLSAEGPNESLARQGDVRLPSFNTIDTVDWWQPSNPVPVPP